MNRAHRLSRRAAQIGVMTVVMLGTNRLEAGEIPRVEALRCTQASCREHSGTIDVSGQDAAQASARLSLVVLDQANEIVVRQPVTAQADGSFSAAVATDALMPGRYRFGVLTTSRPARAVAGGTFTIANGLQASRPIPPVQSRRVYPAGAQDIEPVQAESIEPVRPAEPVASAVQGANPRSRFDRTADNTGPADDSARKQAGGGSYNSFFKTFGLAIPGVVYTTDNYATNTRTTTIAAGAVTKGAVRINSDGTYIWNSAWDGRVIRGRWQPAGTGIILLNAQSGRDWRVERMEQRSGAAEVTVWDQNSIWYNGTPLAR